MAETKIAIVTGAGSGIGKAICRALLRAGFTVVMAVITLLLGLVFLGGAGRPAGARQGLISLGIALLAFGIITFIEPDALGDVLGVTQTSGLVYAILGLIATIAGLVSPTLTTRRAVAERVEADDEVIHVT